MKREKERKSKRDKNGGRTDFPSSGTGKTQLHRCNCSPHRSFASRVRGLVLFLTEARSSLRRKAIRVTDERKENALATRVALFYALTMGRKTTTGTR